MPSHSDHRDYIICIAVDQTAVEKTISPAVYGVLCTEYRTWHEGSCGVSFLGDPPMADRPDRSSATNKDASNLERSCSTPKGL